MGSSKKSSSAPTPQVESPSSMLGALMQSTQAQDMNAQQPGMEAQDRFSMDRLFPALAALNQWGQGAKTDLRDTWRKGIPATPAAGQHQCLPALVPAGRAGRGGRGFSRNTDLLNSQTAV